MRLCPMFALCLFLFTRPVTPAVAQDSKAWTAAERSLYKAFESKQDVLEKKVDLLTEAVLQLSKRLDKQDQNQKVTSPFKQVEDKDPPKVIKTAKTYRLETRYRTRTVRYRCPTCPSGWNSYTVREPYTVKVPIVETTNTKVTYPYLEVPEREEWWRDIKLKPGVYTDDYDGRIFYWNGRKAKYYQQASASFTKPRNTGRGTKSGIPTHPRTGLPAVPPYQSGDTTTRTRDSSSGMMAPLTVQLSQLLKGSDSSHSASSAASSKSFDNKLPPEAQPTPRREVIRILRILNPKRSEIFVDYGCGADARYCIEASRMFKCHSVGIEINKERAEAAKKAVKKAGLEHLVKIIHGDSTLINIKADVGVVYLYEDVLKKLKPKLQELSRFASYIHRVPGMRMETQGDFYVYRKANPRVASTVPYKASQTSYRQIQRTYQPRYFRRSSGIAYWRGSSYTAPVCNNPNCRMCNSIRRQLRR